jgi:hypothetical protein
VSMPKKSIRSIRGQLVTPPAMKKPVVGTTPVRYDVGRSPVSVSPGVSDWLHVVFSGFLTLLVYSGPVYFFSDGLGSRVGTGILIVSAVVSFLLLNRSRRSRTSGSTPE